MIKGKAVNLRSCRLKDLPHLGKWRGDEELMRYYDRLPTQALFEIQDELQRNQHSASQLDFIIETKKGEPIGAIQVKRIDWKDRHAGIEVMVGEKERRIGFGAEALFLLLLYCFRHLNLHKVFARFIFPSASQSLAREIPFVQEAVLRKMIYQKGRYWDIHIYGLLDREFEAFLGTAKGQRYLEASVGSRAR